MIDFPKLGGGMMTVGLAFMQFAGHKWLWWIGCSFTFAGPLLLSIRHRKRKDVRERKT